MKDFDVEERVSQAIQHFKSGYNCSQSVFMAYSDLFDLDQELAKMISVSFGGGMGRMREVCGTVSGMALLAGFKYPVPDTSNQEARKKNYAMVQKMAGLFKEKNGSIVCRELLAPADAASTNPSPKARTKEYYKKRPCVALVEDAARIAGNMLKGKLD